ncbi:MAG TPA: hypothetical protein VJ765_04805 [Chitinophagaceae bacterium]|nr:hypothetical protein [Chitinophagaceae bacterium]
MKKDTIVQFVSFETTLATNDFRAQWEESNKLVTGKQEVTLQQEVDGKNLYRYLSQHRFHDDDIQFTFKKERRSAPSPEIEMRVKEIGGYSSLQLECDHETAANDCKVFVFLSTAPELKLYKELLSYQYLNIYQAYYESSVYTYILEFFADRRHVPQLIEQLKIHNRISEIGVYKECNETKKSRASKAHIVKKAMI